MIDLKIKFIESEHYNEFWADKTLLPINIPFIKRNKDYSLVLTETELRFRKDLFTYYLNRWLVGYNFPKIEVFFNNQKIWRGYVDGYYFDKKNQCDVVNVKSLLWKLKKINVSTNLNNIGSYGNPSTKELYTDGNGFTYVQILYLIRYLFYLADLSLDVSNVSSLLFKAYDGVYYLNDVHYDQLKLDKGMMMCLNQPVSAHRLDIVNTSAEVDFASNKINAFEFISAVCSYFGFCITVNPLTGNYTLYPYQSTSTRNYSLLDSTIYSYSANDYPQEITSSDGYSAVVSLGKDDDSGEIIPSQERVAYTTAGTTYNPRDFVKTFTGEGKERIDLINHFMIIMQNGYTDPPLHNLNTTVNITDLVHYKAKPKYWKHKVERFTRQVDISKLCVNSNTIVVSKEGIYSEIEQDNLGL